METNVNKVCKKIAGLLSTNGITELPAGLSILRYSMADISNWCNASNLSIDQCIAAITESVAESFRDAGYELAEKQRFAAYIYAVPVTTGASHEMAIYTTGIEGQHATVTEILQAFAYTR